MLASSQVSASLPDAAGDLAGHAGRVTGDRAEDPVDARGERVADVDVRGDAVADVRDGDVEPDRRRRR